MQNTLLKFFYGALIVATVSTTGAAVNKISVNHQTAEAETSAPQENLQNGAPSNEITKPRRAETESNELTKINPQIQTATSPSLIQNSSSAAVTFTVAQLATHNTANSCYIAQNGIVYDVTTVSAWAGCTHHGAVGGIDITSIFPHPISYLNNLNKVGELLGSTTNNTSVSGQINKNNQNYSNTKEHETDDNEHENYDFDD